MADSAPQSKSFGLTNQITKDSGHFQPESGRYHLYVANACPYALRTHLTLRLKGLEDHITMSIVHPVSQKTKPDVDDHVGWVFRKEDDEPVKTEAGVGSFSCKGCIPDTVNNAKTIRELYEISDNAPTKYSVPVLWDKKNKTIVNNESAQIIRIFNSAFNDFAKNPKLDLYPERLRAEIDEMNFWVENQIDMKIFKTAFAQNQKDYDEHVNELFENLDKLEQILGKNRYVCGNQLTEADVRLVPNLISFDETFYVLFKCNKKRIADYHNIFNYLREFYQIPGISEAIHIDHVKMSIYTKFPQLNPYAIIPVGPDVTSQLKQKHDRERL